MAQEKLSGPRCTGTRPAQRCCRVMKSGGEQTDSLALLRATRANRNLTWKSEE